MTEREKQGLGAGWLVLCELRETRPLPRALGMVVLALPNTHPTSEGSEAGWGKKRLLPTVL